MKTRIAILISGRGSNMQALLNHIDNGNLEANCVLVFSDKPDAQGLVIAAKRGIVTQSFSPKDCGGKGPYEERLVSLLREHFIEFVVCAGHLKILGETILQAFPYKIINIHPSLLPAFGGLSAQQQAINYGVKISGCTVHFVDQGVDSGPIIAQAATEVTPSDTEESLSRKILKLEHDLYWRALKKVFLGYRIEGRRVFFV